MSQENVDRARLAVDAWKVRGEGDCRHQIRTHCERHSPRVGVESLARGTPTS
jgi:hypothetical protein